MRLILSWLWLLLPIVVFGHSTSQSSTLLVEDSNGAWTLQVRAALTAFEHVVHEAYTADGYSTPEEFEELVTAFLTKNLTLYIDDKEVLLNNPKIKLGHETIVVYQVSLPEDFHLVEMKNIMFQSIYRSKSAFMVLKNGVKRKMFALDTTNNYVARVKIQNDKLVLLNATKSTADISINTLFLLAFVLILLAFALVVGLKPMRILYARNQSQVFSE